MFNACTERLSHLQCLRKEAQMLQSMPDGYTRIRCLQKRHETHEWICSVNLQQSLWCQQHICSVNPQVQGHPPPPSQTLDIAGEAENSKAFVPKLLSPCPVVSLAIQFTDLQVSCFDKFFRNAKLSDTFPMDKKNSKWQLCIRDEKSSHCTNVVRL